MELLQLKYFAEAAKLQSFSKVAKKYMVPPSSVSHTIAKLEKELGAQVFARNGNRIELNDYGRAFYNNISSALEKIENGKTIVNDMQNQTISLTLRQCAYSIIPMLTSFKKAFPDLKLFFPFKVIEQKGSFFIRISATPFQGDEDFISVPLFTEDILVAVPSCNPLAQKSKLTFEDIKDVPIAWFYDCPEGNGIFEYFKQNGYEPNILIGCSKDTTVGEFVKNDFGIAFYPKYSSPIGKMDGIAAVPLEGFTVKRTICASWPKEYILSEASKKFVDFGVEYFKNIEFA
ncbi:MAG: LysR family transcriptional regulator [Clostridia bacterium]|nr:LysR family transcriptional regulator [Clostridia bacterium]